MCSIRMYKVLFLTLPFCLHRYKAKK